MMKIMMDSECRMSNKKDVASGFIPDVFYRVHPVFSGVHSILIRIFFLTFIFLRCNNMSIQTLKRRQRCF